VAGEQRADHHHRGAEAHALGDVAVVADAAVGDDGLGGHAAHHFSALSCQPPVPKPVFSLVMHTLPGPMPTLVASAPQFSRSITRLGRAHVAGDHEGLRQRCLMCSIMRRTLSAWPCAMSMVM
jgi:hypothetical protein